MTHKILLTLVLSIALLVSSCATVGTIASRPEAIAFIQSTYHQLVNLLYEDPSPEVKLAVTLADLALASYSQTSDEKVVQNIELAVKLIKQVLEKYGK